MEPLHVSYMTAYMTEVVGVILYPKYSCDDDTYKYECTSIVFFATAAKTNCKENFFVLAVNILMLSFSSRHRQK